MEKHSVVKTFTHQFQKIITMKRRLVVERYLYGATIGYQFDDRSLILSLGAHSQ